MSICLADFSAVKKELDSLDEQIFGQTRRLRELQLQDEKVVKSAGYIWMQNACELSSIGRLDCEIADREAVSTAYKAVLEEITQVNKTEKV